MPGRLLLAARRSWRPLACLGAHRRLGQRYGRAAGAMFGCSLAAAFCATASPEALCAAGESLSLSLSLSLSVSVSLCLCVCLPQSFFSHTQAPRRAWV